MRRRVTTWADGAVAALDADDPRLAAREAHRVLTLRVHNLLRMDLEQRRAYLREVEQSEGVEAAQGLKAAFVDAWEASRGVGSSEVQKTRQGDKP